MLFNNVFLLLFLELLFKKELFMPLKIARFAERFYA